MSTNSPVKEAFCIFLYLLFMGTFSVLRSNETTFTFTDHTLSHRTSPLKKTVAWDVLIGLLSLWYATRRQLSTQIVRILKSKFFTPDLKLLSLWVPRHHFFLWSWCRENCRSGHRVHLLRKWCKGKVSWDQIFVFLKFLDWVRPQYGY